MPPARRGGSEQDLGWSCGSETLTHAAGLASPLRACRCCPRLTSFSKASRRECPEWVGTYSSNNNPASPTHQPAKFPLREGWVSGFRGCLPGPQALELLSSHASRDTGSALQGHHHGDSSLFFQPVALARSRPLPVETESGRTGAPPLGAQGRLDLQRWCEKKACPQPQRGCAVRSSPRATVAGDSNALGSRLKSPLRSFKPWQQLIFIPFFLHVFFDISY